MSKLIELQVEGHKLVAMRLNGADVGGTPIIFLHGIGGSIGFWGHDQIGAFLERGSCYALSLPGHFPAVFPTDFAKDGLTAELIGRLLSGAIEQLVGKQAVILVGHSTGGFSSLAIALYKPELVERLVIVSGFCHGQWRGWLGFYQKLVGSPVGRWLFKVGYGSGRLNFPYFYQLLRIYVADAKRFYEYPSLREKFQLAYTHYCQLDLDSLIVYFERMPDIQICDSLSAIRVPTLVLTGDSDPIVPSQQAEIISKAIVGAELVVLAGGGHLLFAERPLRYQQALQGWLTKTDAA